jgi:hypothetical protein
MQMIIYPIYGFQSSKCGFRMIQKMKFGQLQESLKWAQNKIFALGEEQHLHWYYG